MWKLLRGSGRGQLVAGIFFAITINLVCSAFGQGDLDGDAKKNISGQTIYQRLDIFPLHKPGNAIYRNDIWLHSKLDTTIKDAIFLPELDSIIMLIEEGDNEKGFLRVFPQVKADIFNKIALKRIETKTKRGKLTIFADNKGQLQVFLFPFNSISAEFVEDDKSRIAFYHLAKIEEDEILETRTYQLRVHVFNSKTNELISLSPALYGSQVRLKISWEGDNLLVMQGGGQITKYFVR
ncbi:MAG: hypothetical protein JJV97_05245 [SAR324 cluster bacterium]|nr:hypothetical protein [SAR324 cluster bacterium]